MSAEEAAAATEEVPASDATPAEEKSEEKEEDDEGGLDDDEEEMITLIAQGGSGRFPINANYCKLSNFVQTIRAGDGEATEIEVKQVGKDTLEQVVKYLNMHKGEAPADLPCPVRSTDMTKIVTFPEDAVYIDSYDKKAIFEIILAANYMDIKPLLHLGCAKIATLIKQLDQKEINRIIEEEEKWQKEHGAAAGVTPAEELKLGDEDGAGAAPTAAAGADASAAPSAAADDAKTEDAA